MGRLQMIAQLGVVLILLCLQYHVEAASSTVVTFYATGYADSHTASIYALGLSAPLHINNDLEVYTSIGVAVTQSTASSIFSSYNNQPGYMAILGPAGGDTLFNIYSNIFSDSTAMFSPLLQTMNLQEAGGMYSIFNEKTYWLIPSDQAQVVGIMFFLSQHPLLPMQHTALAYTVNGINVLSTQALQAVAPVLGITGLSVKSSGGRSFTSGAYSSVFPSAPGVVYQLLESTYAYPSQWIEQMVTDTAFINANTTIGTTFTFDYITLQAYIQKAGAVAILPSQNMLTASPVPGIDSVEYQASHDFDSQASNTIATVSTSSEKNFIMAGWVGGWALMQALNKYTGTSIAVKQPFYNALNHAQSMFLVSDLYYGSMGGSCSNTAISQGSICSCRWAGNNVWFHTLKKTGNTYDSAPLQGALFQYAQGTCANIYTTPTASQLQLPRTVHAVGFSTNDNEMMSSMCSQTNNVIETAANTTRFWHHSSHAYRGYCLPTSMSSASSDLSTHQRTYVTTSLMGVIPDNVVAGSTPPSSLILDFMPQTTQLHLSKANFVYLFPTLEQELYVLASYLSGVVGSTSVVCAVVRSSKYSAAITALLTKTFTTFGITPSSGNVNQPTGDLGSSISASCTHTFVIGAASADAAGILGVMQQKSTSVVLMSFEDLTKQYNAFVSAFGGADASVTDRLVFPTNLPRWTGSTLSSGTLGGASALSTVGEFVETLPPEAQTPAAVRAFIVAMLYDQLTMGTSWGQPDMQAALYGNVTLRVGGMTFGPFAQNWGTQGIQNYGAQNISVWSFTRVVDPTARVLEEPMNPSLVYDTATTSIAYDAGAMEKEEDCIERQQSSSVEKHTTTTENPKAGDSVPTASTTREVTSSGMSLAHHSSSSLKPVLKAVLFGLVAVLCALIVYIVILLLLYFGILRRLAIFLGSLACFQCCGFRSCGSAEKAARKMRAFINIQMEEDCNLECAVSSINLVPCSSSSRLTVVFMEVEQWRQLWLRQPEVMSRAVRQFQRCVKRAAVKHSTYVMQRVEGFLIFVCPSADAALIFVREALINIANLDARDVIVMSDEYKQLGCGGATVEGLRLRVAMHTGTTIGFPDPSGRVHIRGAAVDGAVAAACAAGAAGSVVLTATALTECGLTEGDHDVQCVGQCPLNTGELKDALYVIPIDSGATSRVEQSSVAEVQSARRTTLDKAPGQGTGELWLWCVRQLEQHYAGMSDSQRIADLRAIGQLFVLPEALKKEYDSDRSEYCELLRGVCQQVASMMECRHGLSPAAKLPNLLHAQEENAEGSTVLSSSPGYGANRLGAGGSSWRSQKELRKRQRSVQLRHFAYSSGEESYPDEDV